MGKKKKKNRAQSFKLFCNQILVDEDSALKFEYFSVTISGLLRINI
jgi:hypothetical protein